MIEQRILRIGKAVRVAGVIIVALLGLNACMQNVNSPNPSPIKIGISLSTSGDFGSDGLAMEQGYQLWANAINNTGGLLGRPVELIILHDKSDPAQAVANYHRLIKNDHVDLVFGPFSSLITKAVAKETTQDGYVLLEGAGGGPSVFQQGSNLFDVSLPVANALVSSALYILSLPASERPKTAAYATENDPFTQPQVDVARQLLERGGIRTVYYGTYAGDKTQEYTVIAQKVVSSGASVTILGTVLPDVVAFIQTFKQSGYNPQLIAATAGPDQGGQFVKAVGLSSTEGIMVPNGWYPQANNYQNADMVKTYVTRYGGTPEQMSADVAEAFSVGQVAAQAITKTGSLDNQKFTDELRQDSFNTVQGTVKFDGTGQNTLALPYLFQWQKGALIPVYPDFVATANPEFPKASWS
jgi:branched-chain amino acid transport system substrate-binding protein